MNYTLLMYISGFIIMVAGFRYSSIYNSNKERQFKLDMASKGLEQCANPHAKYSGESIIWVKTCPEHLK